MALLGSQSTWLKWLSICQIDLHVIWNKDSWSPGDHSLWLWRHSDLHHYLSGPATSRSSIHGPQRIYFKDFSCVHEVEICNLERNIGCTVTNVCNRYSYRPTIDDHPLTWCRFIVTSGSFLVTLWLFLEGHQQVKVLFILWNMSTSTSTTQTCIVPRGCILM